MDKHVPASAGFSLEDGEGGDDFRRRFNVSMRAEYAAAIDAIKSGRGAPQGKCGAAKHDAGKLPIGRGFMDYFPNAIEGIAEVSQFGYDKYGAWGGWRDVPDAYGRYKDALMRHLTAAAAGEMADPESGLQHLAHAAWNILALIELSVEK